MDKEYKDEYAEQVADAVRVVKIATFVTAHVADVQLGYAKESARLEIKNKVFEALQTVK